MRESDRDFLITLLGNAVAEWQKAAKEQPENANAAGIAAAALELYYSMDKAQWVSLGPPWPDVDSRTVRMPSPVGGL
jgi:hypothetical protein